jgi:hypothetical protein
VRYISMIITSNCLLASLSSMSLAQNCPVFPLPCGGKDCTWDPSKSGIQLINDARTTENLPALSLPAAYSTAPGDQKIIMLINAERKSRGLYALNNGTDQNDPLIGYMAYNHSKLLADIPAIGNDGPHDNAVDGTFGDRLASMPGQGASCLTGNDPIGCAATGRFGPAGEIITGQRDPEMAMWSWMYGDASQSWGHRNGILGCKIKFAGAGVAPTINGNTNYTVDFIDDPDNSYKMLPPDTPKPGPLAVSVEAKAILVDHHVSAQLHITVGPFRTLAKTFPNRPKWVYMWTPASWGKPVGTIPILGRPPVGSGGFQCALSKGQGTPGVDGLPVLWMWCDAVVPLHGTPHVITVVDIYSNTSVIHQCDSRGAVVAGELCFDLKYDPGVPTDEAQER